MPVARFDWWYCWVLTISLLIFCLLIFSLCSLCFSDLEASIRDILRLKDYFLSHVWSTNKTYQKYFSFLLQYFLKSLSVLFWFFHRFHLSAHIAHLFLHAVYLICWALNILTIIISNPWSDDFNISTMSGSNPCSLFKLFYFLVCLLIFPLIAWTCNGKLL